MIGISKTNKSKTERKTLIEIVNSIFDILEDGKLHTISNLARETKSNWRTIKNQVNLIVEIQKRPKIEILSSTNNILIRKL